MHLPFVFRLEKLKYQNQSKLFQVLLLKIPENINLISYILFRNCDSLEEIKVDSKNKFYCDEDGVLFNKDKTILIVFPKNKHVYYYQVPNTVKIINEYAFYGLCYENVYFKKDLVIQFYDLKNHIKLNTEFKFIYFTNTYLFS